MERLKATLVVRPTDNLSSSELPQFVTDSRNIACIFTTSQTGNLNLPWEPNNYGNSATSAAPHCSTQIVPSMVAAGRE
ncbi:hypothetical protein ACX80D_06475 [Arthrobacter sp. Sr24]